MAIASTPEPSTRLFTRPYDVTDEIAVLGLVNADRVTGQPMVDAVMLKDALAGRSVVDSGWWAELETPQTAVVQAADGRVRGVVSYTVRPSDQAGFILWLHGLEESTVLTALISHVFSHIGLRTVHAFEFASALGLGMEGLPVRHRAATRTALENLGFIGRDLWRYMRVPLPVNELPHVAHHQTAECEDPPGRRLEVHGADSNEVRAEAVIGRPVAGIGVLWWISVNPAQRGQGLGTQLLGTALDLLHNSGADEAILFVDDDAPSDDPERGRAAANRLYDRAGFREIDRLWSFTFRP